MSFENVKLAIFCYDTYNIGDEIQSIAMKNLLPKVDFYVLRDNMNIVYDSDYNRVDTTKLENSNDKIYLFINGWMSEKTDRKGNNYVFPPPSFIVPFFISIHTTAWYIKHVVNPNIEYFRSLEFVGCRDMNTYNILKSKGINAEFMGCPTVTLKNPYDNPERSKIYFVDAKATIPNVNKITHIVRNNTRTLKERFDKAQRLLDRYATAESVFTSRLHCYMPCKGMGTKVTLMARKDARMRQLVDLSDDKYENIKRNIKDKVEYFLDKIKL